MGLISSVRSQGTSGDWNATTADGVYQRIRAVRRTQYEVLSEIPLRNLSSEIDDEADLLPDNADIYLQLPSELDPRIVDLAEAVTTGGDTVLEQASLVETYLRTNHAYSLELTWDPGEQPLSTFLFQARSGHCEYFASSMAILLRTVGIPTRIVNGFLAGEYNSIGDSYIVRQSDAHSWVEVFVPGQGWIEFDPTPPDPNRNEISMLVLFSHYLDAAELFWNAYILTYDTGTQLQLFQNAQDLDPVGTKLSAEQIRVVGGHEPGGVRSRFRTHTRRCGNPMVLVTRPGRRLAGFRRKTPINDSNELENLEPSVWPGRCGPRRRDPTVLSGCGPGREAIRSSIASSDLERVGGRTPE